MVGRILKTLLKRKNFLYDIKRNYKSSFYKNCRRAYRTGICYGHLQNAVNIPLDAITANADKVKNFNAPAIIFYCRSGNRSGQAVNYLGQLVCRMFTMAEVLKT